MGKPRPEADYTLADHEYREHDPYALGKYRLTLRWLEQLRAPGVERLFNVGCGSGVFNRLAVDAGFEVEAFEPDEAAYDLAVAQSPTARCRVHNAGLFEVPGDGSADVMVLHDVLEHIEDDTAAARHAASVLRPGGWLLVTVPALQSLFGYHDEQLGHHRRYSSRSLRRVLEPYLEVTRARYYGLTFLPITAWYSRVRKAPYPVTAGDEKLSLAQRAFGLACRLESAVPTPVGTSVVMLARRPL